MRIFFFLEGSVSQEINGAFLRLAGVLNVHIIRDLLQVSLLNLSEF